MKKRIYTSKRILLCGLLILVVGAAAWFFLNRDNKRLADVTTTSADSSRDAAINYGPPTEEEKQQAEDHKDELVKQRESQSSEGNKKEVTVSITSATNVSGPNVAITGFVQGVVEEGGTCTATLTKGEDRKKESTTGVADASTTNCRPIDVQLSTGDWQLALNYSSPSATGSATKTLIVQ